MQDDDADPKLYEPMAHATQVSEEFAPLADENVPSAQPWQFEEESARSDVEYFPAAHRMHADDPMPELNDPMTH